MHSTSGHELHFVLETLAYLVGARVYWRASAGRPMPAPGDRWLILGSAILGAFLGSKLLHVAQHADRLALDAAWPLWLAGKSVLGGFMGGTLAVEVAKRFVGWRRPTGDAWAPALAAGLVVGRLGCQFSGTWDQTYGTPTTLPWAWDYGDGVGRHPTALYEILLVALAYRLARVRVLRDRPGASFAAFMALYCLARLGLEFLKPPFGADAPGGMPVMLHAGLTAIQWAAIAGVAWFALLLHTRLASTEALRRAQE